MSESKHTATPFRIAPDGITIHAGNKNDPTIIADCAPNDPMAVESEAEQEANAAFIVEACNSYDALKARNAELKAALRKIDDMDFNSENPYQLADLMAEHARAALANEEDKADG